LREKNLIKEKESERREEKFEPNGVAAK